MSQTLQSSPSLFFDLDGTLVDTAEDIADALNTALREIDVPPRSFEEIVSFIGDGLGQLINRAIHPRLELADHCMHLFRTHYRSGLLNKTRPYPGTESTLQILKDSGFILNVITNKNRDFSVEILKGLNLDHYFDEVIGGDTLPVRKPSPDAILLLRDKQNLDLQKSFMIGDHHTDMDCGANASVRRIFCTFGMGILDGRTPDFTADSYEEIRQIVMG
jgi:phosphoglycolate phosphatase